MTPNRPTSFFRAGAAGSRAALPLLLAAALAACGSRPAVPDWELNAQGSATKATQAFLSGDTRVAELEWSRARGEVARTGRPDLLARLELLRCAAQRAALDLSACGAFEALRADAQPAERAYADYLAGRIAPGELALLPAAQRQAAAAPGDARVLRGIDDPLSRLVAASVAVGAAGATDDMVALAVDTASEQGWRRALLAWLGLQVRQAQAAGNAAGAAAAQRRIDVVLQKGAPGR